MIDDRTQAWLHFVATHRKKLATIAYKTDYEYQREDVESEAWLLAEAMRHELGAGFDIADPACQDQLFARLYSRLVKFAEKNVRYGVRLDHHAHGEEEQASHPLLRKLAADGGANPLTTLLGEEAAVPEPEAPDPHHSRAASYLWLLRKFDNRMSHIADYLLISTSHCYRCCKRARLLAEQQWPLPALRAPAQRSDDEPIRPWRTFRVLRPALQLELPFDECPDLWKG